VSPLLACLLACLSACLLRITLTLHCTASLSLSLACANSLVVKKDFRSDKHPHIEGPSNLEVLNLVKSLESREYVRVTFSWQYNYVYLTDKGIEYLRQYLALPDEIVPNTHKKQATRPDSRDREEDKVGGGGRPAFRGDREYRGREGGGGGGFGRGGGAM
jgi:small subunit ribosomal protein S10e